ncbi:MAG: serine/threonine protein kinase, partial [Elusimicrobia bacterium]|nr:serine/threonine protein kinase [Elusimicrobiota bacterium]
PARRVPPLRAAAGPAAAVLALLVLLWPLWRRLNLQETEETAMGALVPSVPAARADDGTAEAERARLLGGKYELKAMIGRGGMAHVWEAYDRSQGRPAAVKKVIIPEGPRAAYRRALALQEARTLSSLRHPAIVEIYEALELDSGLYLVFEFLQGKTLQQILAEERRLPWSRVRAVLLPACQALEFAHAHGFVHRDFKPSNVMVTRDGRVKVMDFGIARALSEGVAPVEAGVEPQGPGPSLSLARTSNLVGTPGYRPPEAERGLVSTAFDVYSLGAVAFEAVTGELPPRAGPGSTERVWERLQLRCPELPARVGKAIQACLVPEMGSRAQSVQYFRCQALES